LGAAGTAALPQPRGWHYRGYLPHFDGGDIAQSVTFRLGDSMPRSVLETWQQQLEVCEKSKADKELRRRIEEYLDQGRGECFLRDPCIGRMVQSALLFFDESRYHLHAWVVMPNHLHVLFVPDKGHALSDILHSWKSYTSKEANRILGRKGLFWEPDYWDRFIRNETHFAAVVAYIESNPVKAGLCERPEDWPFSSANWIAANSKCGRDASGSAGVPPA
jgi:REP element-mobilizing transposase RayT